MFYCLCRLAFFAVPPLSSSRSCSVFRDQQSSHTKCFSQCHPSVWCLSHLFTSLPRLRSQAACIHLQFRALSRGTPTSNFSMCFSLSEWFWSIVLYCDLFWLLVIDLLSKSKVSCTQGKNKLITSLVRVIQNCALQRCGVNGCTLASPSPWLPFFAWSACLSCHWTPLSD